MCDLRTRHGLDGACFRILEREDYQGLEGYSFEQDVATVRAEIGAGKLYRDLALQQRFVNEVGVGHPGALWTQAIVCIKCEQNDFAKNLLERAVDWLEDWKPQEFVGYDAVEDVYVQPEEPLEDGTVLALEEMATHAEALDVDLFKLRRWVDHAYQQAPRVDLGELQRKLKEAPIQLREVPHGCFL